MLCNNYTAGYLYGMSQHLLLSSTVTFSNQLQSQYYSLLYCGTCNICLQIVISSCYHIQLLTVLNFPSVLRNNKMCSKAVKYIISLQCVLNSLVYWHILASLKFLTVIQWKVSNTMVPKDLVSIQLKSGK